jgi:hypothetical protein
MIIIARGLVSEKEVLSNADGSSYSHRQQTLRSLYVGVPTSDNDSRTRGLALDSSTPATIRYFFVVPFVRCSTHFKTE